MNCVNMHITWSITVCLENKSNLFAVYAYNAVYSVVCLHLECLSAVHFLLHVDM
jgi:hypothetical protein